MKRPVLVRELTREISPESAQPIITDLNKTGTAALTGAERAIADSNKISEATLDQLAGMIENQGPDGTLTKALEGRAGAHVVDLLIRDGVVTTQEKPTLFTQDGNLTPAAKDRISKLMLGRVFKDSEQFDAAQPALRNKLERIMAPLSRVAGKPEWDLLPEVRGAVDMLEAARAAGIKHLDDLVAQQSVRDRRLLAACGCRSKGDQRHGAGGACEGIPTLCQRLARAHDVRRRYAVGGICGSVWSENVTPARVAREPAYHARAEA
jgi:hypothetical protein